MKTEKINYILFIKEPDSIQLIERLINWFKTILIDVCKSIEIIVEKKEINVKDRKKNQGLNKWLD
ncbi:MAG: hypothetical protein ACW98D_11815 [Promethearchaeota archaeon]|jgi:hypothetical protein